MGRVTAFLDASVLYPAPLRDVLMQLALADMFRARWSADVHREWIEALLRRDPSRDRARLERTRALMDDATLDALVTGYELLIPALVLPDADDRHVLAAAVVGRCDVILTHNLKDFPHSMLAQYGIEALAPDPFLHGLLELNQEVFCRSVRRVRQRLQNPPYSVEAYLRILEGQGLTETVGVLERYAPSL